jgi:hypothetical protein
MASSRSDVPTCWDRVQPDQSPRKVSAAGEPLATGGSVTQFFGSVGSLPYTK